MEQFPDGLDALRCVLSVREIMSLVERTAQWVSPETFKLLPVWFPEHARRGLFYKKNWSEPQMNRSRATGNSIHKSEGNLYAMQALTLALGLRKQQRTNWSCCHMWGVDDASYQRSNTVVQDSRFFSCVGNMILLPSPLKAFTDTMPEVKAMLRICASNLYGWQCDHEELSEGNLILTKWNDWDAYPDSWPRTPNEKRPVNVVETSALIAARAHKRLATIRHDLKNAGSEYPRERVIAALSYWDIPV